MDKKYKIIVLADHPLATSGVGIQTRLLIEGLIKTGKYSFRCLGGAIKHHDYSTITVNPDFIVKPTDGFGNKEMIREILATEEPDNILLVTDPRQFIWLWEMEEEVHDVCPISYWTIWDNPPVPQYNHVLYDSTDLLNCISYTTYELLTKMFPKEQYPGKVNYIPHAFPKSMYHPLPKEQIKQFRAQHFGDKKDWFIGLWVNRNATRKVPSDVLESWKMFLDNLQEKEGHRKAFLLMHTDPTDQEGPNLFAVAEMLGINDNVLFSPNRIGFEEMNIIHNSVDFCVNISKAEGWGLTTHISMQCGVPIIAGKTGGETRKVVDWRDGSQNGIAIDPVKTMLVGSQMVPYIYEDFFAQKDVANAFYKIYKMTDQEKEAMSKKMRDYIDFECDYDKMITAWDKTLEKAILDWREKKWDNNKRWNLQEIIPTPQQMIQQVKPANLPVEINRNLLPLPPKKTIDINALIKAKQQAKGI